MGAASAVEFCLIAGAIAVVVWKAQRIEHALEAQRAAEAMQQSAVEMEHRLHRQAAAMWRAVLGQPGGQDAFTSGAQAFRTEWEAFSRGAVSSEQRVFAE